MKVRELIEALSEVDPELPVVVGYDGDWVGNEVEPDDIGPAEWRYLHTHRDRDGAIFLISAQ